MVPNDPKLSQEVPNDPKLTQVFPNGPKWSQMSNVVHTASLLFVPFFCQLDLLAKWKKISRAVAFGRHEWALWALSKKEPNKRTGCQPGLIVRFRPTLSINFLWDEKKTSISSLHFISQNVALLKGSGYWHSYVC